MNPAPPRGRASGAGGHAGRTTRLKSGAEPFHAGGASIGPTLLDCWRWSHSDLLSAAWRGVLAEFVIASALGLAAEPRVEWAAYDLRTRSGVAIEVKSAAYVQAWRQDRPSVIEFDIAPRKQVWNPATNETTVLPEPRRLADVYVFCVLGRRDRTAVDPLDVDQWAFYVLGRAYLDRERPGQKTIGLNALLSLLRRAPRHVEDAVRYGELPATIERAGGVPGPAADSGRTA